MIYAHRADEVFDTIASLLDRLEAAGPYRSLFDRALHEVRRCADAGASFLAIDMPMAVAEALQRPPIEQQVTAAACTLLWSGADLMDDAADGELGPVWEGVSSHQLALVSANLLSTLPHLVITTLRGIGVQEKSLARFSQLVSQTLWEMSRGQFADLGGAYLIRSKEDYGDLIELKTGAEIALFASAPAVLGGLPDDQIAAWSALGVAYGCMSQLFTDVLSAFSEPPANDLLGGKRTLPVLCTLDLLEGQEREAFELDLAAAASGDIMALKKVVQCMTEKRAIFYCLLGVEDLRWRAINCLPLRLSDLAVDHPLRSILKRFSIL